MACATESGARRAMVKPPAAVRQSGHDDAANAAIR
jgi:hypothetical protein